LNFFEFLLNFWGRGAVLAAEMKGNNCKMSRWVALDCARAGGGGGCDLGGIGAVLMEIWFDLWRVAFFEFF
jgi:hypothetical protein